jgi:carboxyl-terminal processing protease
MIRDFSKAVMLFFLAITILSCKKDKVESDVPTPTTNRSELTKDSIFLYAKEVYLWNTKLPSYAVFKPRNYNSSSNQWDNFNEILLRITKYSGYENVAGYPNEPKFSYIDDLVASGQIAFKSSSKASVNLNGDGNDTGLNFGFLGTEQDYDIVVRYISPGSFAASQNQIKRGDIILTINGVSYGSDFNNEISRIENALEQNIVTVTGRKGETGTPFSLTLNKTSYVSSPVLKDSVYTEGSKIIGYLAYARFSDEVNSVAALNSVFQKFANKGVTDLVIDLRYNGGGFVSTAEHLTNLIAPARLANQTMFTEYYNSTMQNRQATILKNQPRRDERGNITSGNYFDNATFKSSDLVTRFTKTNAGYLNNIEKVVFITSGSTASSSELVINSLKPHITVKTVGKQSYGKPVGFFPIRIDKYDVYYAMFETRNSLNQALYYDGFKPDKDIFDDFRYDFGDKRENNLAHTLYYLDKGVFSGSSFIASTKGAKTSAAPTETRVLDEKGIRTGEFKGMIGSPTRK